MSMQFDPYHAWLGIPSNEQPPNHYRLLGITLFESDDEVIQNGLDQRIAHLKSFLNGPNSHDSERLLEEVSKAGVCLLRPESKQVYDRQLQSNLRANAETVAVRTTLATPPTSPASPVSPPPRQTIEHAPPSHEASAPMVAGENPHWREQPANGGFPIVPVIVGGATGLGVACLTLALLLPGSSSSDRVVHLNAPLHAEEDPSDSTGSPIDEGAPQTALDPDGQAPGETSPTDGSAANTVENGKAAAPKSPAEVGPTSSPTSPLPSQGLPDASPRSSQLPPASWPRPLPGSPPPNSNSATDPLSSPFPLETAPAAPSSPAGSLGASATIEGTSKSIVLDLERSSMNVTLAEDVEGKEVQVQVQGLSDLATPYHLQPFGGIVSLEQSVDIAFSDYAGVKIRLAMHRRGKDVELEIAPEIETGEGKTSDFSKRKLDNVKRAMIKDNAALSKQLAAAQSEALTLQNVMSRPAAATVRNAQKQRYSVLMAQIPVLQNQLAYVQTRKDVLQQLSLLAKRIHEKATLNLTVQIKPAAKADQAE